MSEIEEVTLHDLFSLEPDERVEVRAESLQEFLRLISMDYPNPALALTRVEESVHDDTGRVLDNQSPMTRMDVEIMAHHYGIDADELESRFCNSRRIAGLVDNMISASWDTMEDVARDVARESGVDVGEIGGYSFTTVDFDEAVAAYQSQTTEVAREVVTSMSRAYATLYGRDELDGVEREAMRGFDQFVKRNPEFVGLVARTRGDLVSSDREAAAFMFAYADVMGTAPIPGVDWKPETIERAVARVEGPTDRKGINLSGEAKASRAASSALAEDGTTDTPATEKTER